MVNPKRPERNSKACNISYLANVHQNCSFDVLTFCPKLRNRGIEYYSVPANCPKVSKNAMLKITILLSEIERQLVKAPLAAAISPF